LHSSTRNEATKISLQDLEEDHFPNFHLDISDPDQMLLHLPPDIMLSLLLLSTIAHSDLHLLG
jgi:hypothetical protein